MSQGPTETNDEYFEQFNYRLQNLILAGVKHILCSLKNMDKVGETATPGEVMTEE